MVTDERFSEAAGTLAPLAYSPHPGEHTERARELLKKVEARLAERIAAADRFEHEASSAVRF